MRPQLLPDITLPFELPNLDLDLPALPKFDFFNLPKLPLIKFPDIFPEIDFGILSNWFDGLFGGSRP